MRRVQGVNEREAHVGGSPQHEDDPDLEDIRGLRMAASGGRAGLGWITAFLILPALGLALWAYLR